MTVGNWAVETLEKREREGERGSNGRRADAVTGRQVEKKWSFVAVRKVTIAWVAERQDKGGGIRIRSCEHG